MEEQTAAQKRTFRREALERMTDLSVSGLGLAAALAWNDAIQELFRLIFGEAATLVAKFFYAVLITVVVVLFTRYLTRLAMRYQRPSS